MKPASSFVSFWFFASSARSTFRFLRKSIGFDAVAFLVLASSTCLLAQTGAWAWMGGSSTPNQPGVYGTLGVPASSNLPGGRTLSASWIDSSGNHWVFGGDGCDSAGAVGLLNDLWELNTSTGQWTWIGGGKIVASNGLGQPGVYGGLGVPAAANTPGGRGGAATWIDSSGNLWLFGGQGAYTSASASYELNDLWKFSPVTHEWTWMGGGIAPGNAGTLGVPAAGNIPNGRDSAASWTDASGKFWLFGGENPVSGNGSQNFTNDLWEFDPATIEWAWMGGSTSPSIGGVYGTSGIFAPNNFPGSRSGESLFTDISGNRWIFGGMGLDANAGQGFLNDLWQFNSSYQEWAWVAGNQVEGGYSTTNFLGIIFYGTAGQYGKLGLAASGNVPGARVASANWIDTNGNLWILGGEGFDSTGKFGSLNDLWQFSPSTREWTWMGGSNVVGNNGSQPPVYGTPETPAAGNTPGGRLGAISWTDGNGNLWLFGGVEIPSTGTRVFFNDLWEYQTSVVVAATPTFTVAPGTYTSPVTVTISDATAGATIYYTTNGTAPTTSSAAYTGPITVSSTETVEAVAIANGYAQSAVASATYTITQPAATPTFSVASGTYTSSFTVTISDATPGATIYYTINGTAPPTGPAVYTGPITVSSTETLGAVAIANGYVPSAAAFATYTIAPPAAAPTFSVVPGTYVSPVTVSISDATMGATIYYTTNGTTPTTSSAVYSGPITIKSTVTIEAIAFAPGYAQSAVASATYIITPPTATPTFSVAPGTYASQLTVTISDATPGATIYFTTNGTAPSTNSIVYRGPISFSSTETLEAVAIAKGFVQSAVASAKYIIIITPGFSPSNANFGGLSIGAASPVQTLTYTFGADVTLGSTAVLTQGAAGLDFADAGTGTCALNTTYAQGDTCTVDLTFTSRFAGTRNGAIVLSDSDGNVIATAYLQGIGVGSQINFLPGTESVVADASGSLLAPYAIALDGSGSVYVADNGANVVVKETLSAGGYTQSTIPTSSLSDPTGVAVDGGGNVYIADTANNRVLKESPSAGGYMESVVADLANNNIFAPIAVAVDGTGNLYFFAMNIQDNQEYLYKEAPSGNSYIQSTVPSGVSGTSNFAVDSNGNVYVMDSGNSQIIKEEPSAAGYTQSIVPTDSSIQPCGIAVDEMGDIYITPCSSGVGFILKETPTVGTFVQSTIATSPLNEPLAIAVDSSGNVYIADTSDSRVLKEDLADVPSLVFASTAVGSTSADSPQTVTVENIGNADLSFPVPSTGANPSIGTDFILSGNSPNPCPVTSNGSSAAGALAAGASCALSINFTPTAGGSLNESLVLTDNNLNAASPAYATQSIQLSGSGIATPTITWPAPAAITFGTPLTATQLNATSTVAGTFTYSPAAGTVLGAGTQSLSVTFTPTDPANYNAATATVGLTVTKVTSTLTWPTPTAIAAGTPLSSAQLDAAASVPGTFTYTPPAGTVLATGNQTLTCVFTPTDSADYNTATAAVSLAVILAPGFTLTASPADLLLRPRSSARSAITVNPANGFRGLVKLTTSGLPRGVTASYSPNTTTSTSTLRLEATNEASIGPVTLTVTGTSGPTIATTTVRVMVR